MTLRKYFQRITTLPFPEKRSAVTVSLEEEEHRK